MAVTTYEIHALESGRSAATFTGAERSVSSLQSEMHYETSGEVKSEYRATILAAKIIAVAQMGERDPVRLRESRRSAPDRSNPGTRAMTED
jgi:hypothetical protein